MCILAVWMEGRSCLCVMCAGAMVGHPGCGVRVGHTLTGGPHKSSFNSSITAELVPPSCLHLPKEQQPLVQWSKSDAEMFPSFHTMST